MSEDSTKDNTTKATESKETLEKQAAVLFENAKAFPSTEPLAFLHEELGCVLLLDKGVILYPKDKAPTPPASADPPAAKPEPKPDPAPPPANDDVQNQMKDMAKQLADLKKKMDDELKAKDKEIKRLKEPADPQSRSSVENAADTQDAAAITGAHAIKGWMDTQ